MMLVLLPGFAFGHDYTLGDLRIEHPVARSAAATAMTSAGYLTVLNTGAEADTLIAVEAPFTRVELHSAITDADGITRMVKQETGIVIAPGETLTLAPGGFHVMFMGLNGDALEVGEAVEGTLVFERAGRLDVSFNVEDVAATGADHNLNHDTMDHDAHMSGDD
ncbi:copper chaperone PCu(A)C [Loktanella sp. SALINAS62]|nr:copper chaperone PCu(A)C [Loktanella sp. SALINAS62]